MIDSDKQLYHDALGKWGKDTQILIAVEEMAELTFWLCKMIRENPAKYSRRESEILSAIIEEMADVEVIFGQLKYLFDNEVLVESIRNLKKKRMLKRIEG